MLVAAFSFGVVGLSSWADAATKSTETTIPGSHPHSALCRKLHTLDLSVRGQKSNIREAQAGNWAAYQKVLGAEYRFLVKTSQEVIELGSGAPHDVLSAAHRELASGAAEQRIILRSRDMAELDALSKTAGIASMSAWTPVLQYVYGQCGATGSSVSTTFSGSSGELDPSG